MLLNPVPQLPQVGVVPPNKHCEEFPADVLSGTNRELGLLFKVLATLRTDAPTFKRIDELRWKGPTGSFPAITAKIAAERLLKRVLELARKSNN